MSRVLQLSLTALLGLALASPVLAEVIVLPNGHTEAAKLPEQPTRGMTMRQVRSRFGAPLKELAPTPTAPNYPTITRWVYSDYTVYFADTHVIHTVVHGGKAAQATTSGKP
jgi:hypothetical protein